MSSRPMTRAEARAWKARWAAVNAVQDAELRRMSSAEGLRRLEELREFVAELPPDSSREAEIEIVRRRWIRLRSGLGR